MLTSSTELCVHFELQPLQRDRHGDVDPGEERQSEPSPTPEPGTMLLLGGALVAGMRRFRKR